MVRDRGGSFCVCSGSALSDDLSGVHRSVESDSLFVLSMYPRILLSVLFVSSLQIIYL